MNHKYYTLVGVLIIYGLIIVACLPTAEKLIERPQADMVLPTPTVHSIFKNQRSTTDAELVGVSQEMAVPTVAGFFQQHNTPTPRPLPTSRVPKISPANLPRDIDFIRKTVFEDELNSNWILLEDRGVDFTVDNSSPVYTGSRSISMLPTEGNGQLFFAIDEKAQEQFSRDQVLGVSFRLNGGDDSIPLDGLSVSVVGSNTTPYWSADDNSVQIDDGSPTFSETRLYFLGFNDVIPANTWVEVVVWLEELIYDPTYEYVTGLYIKNDEFFLQEVFIDAVALLLTEESAKLPTAVTATPTITATTSISATTSITKTTAVTVTVTITTTAIPVATLNPTGITTQPPPQPTPEVPAVPVEALKMDLWVLAGLGLCSDGTWQQKVFIEGHGGDNTYTNYWNGNALENHPDPGLLFTVYGVGDGDVVGTGKVVSGDGQMVERQLIVPPPEC